MRDLNHPKVRPFTRDIALQLRLDQTFVDFVFAKERPEPFRYWVEDANRGWTCYIPDNITVAYPLWSTNGDQTLLLLSGSMISYGQGWHDNPDMEVISRTSQGLLANLLNSIWESEASEAEMEELAEFCGFRYLSDLLEFVNTHAPDDAEWEQKWRQFISAIDARSI